MRGPRQPPPALTRTMNVSSPVLHVKQQLIYLLYGERRIYQLEAKLSILTALARCKPADVPVIRVLTDQPQAFFGWPVEVITLDEQTLQAWTGDGGYTHRRKACAIAHAGQWADKTVFIDTDTVFLQSPHKLFSQVDAGQFLVDEVEANWGEASRNSDYLRFSAGLVEAGNAPADDLQLCNSGVMGFTRCNVGIAERAIPRIDAWAPYAADLHTIEQIAFSFELHGAKVNEARGVISHYFAMKQYVHAVLEIFFARHGEHFHSKMPGLALKVPAHRPVPSWLARLSVKWSLKRVPRELRGIGRKLLYGSVMNRDDYQRACKVIWWRSAIEDMRRLGDFDWNREWPAGLPRLGQRDEVAFSEIVRAAQRVS